MPKDDDSARTEAWRLFFENLHARTGVGSAAGTLPKATVADYKYGAEQYNRITGRDE